MRSDILARYPEDIGKRLRYSYGASVILRAGDPCEGYNNECQEDADVVIQGETDSGGCELIFFCSDCEKLCEQACEGTKEALDVEDKCPKPGHLWYVSERTNHEIGSRGSWSASFDSFRDATVFLRAIDVKAEPYCGLYPGNGIQELPVDEIARYNRQAADSLEAECQAEEEWRDNPAW